MCKQPKGDSTMANALSAQTKAALLSSPNVQVVHVGAKGKKEAPPMTTVKGKTVQVTGTKGGAISQAVTQAKAARLSGSNAPGSVGKYAGAAAIKQLPDCANPHRAGTYRFKAFAAMQAAKTAGDYALSGYKAKYLERWVKLGLIRVG